MTYFPSSHPTGHS